jgi:hypothetical protein
MSLRHNAVQLAGTARHRKAAQGGVRRRKAAQESRPPLWHHSVPEVYCMDAATMSLELHERGIHAV